MECLSCPVTELYKSFMNKSIKTKAVMFIDIITKRRRSPCWNPFSVYRVLQPCFQTKNAIVREKQYSVMIWNWIRYYFDRTPYHYFQRGTWRNNTVVVSSCSELKFSDILFSLCCKLYLLFFDLISCFKLTMLHFYCVKLSFR